MAADDLVEKLTAAIADGEPFGPSDPDAPRVEIPGQTLRELIRGEPEGEDGARILKLRRVHIVDALNLEAEHIGLRLLFQDCEIEEVINLDQARAVDIRLLKCKLRKELSANQLEIKWNFDLVASSAERGVSLYGAKIGGRLSMNNTTLEGRMEEGGAFSPALNAHSIEISGNMLCDGLTSIGEVGMLGADVGGQLSMNGATIEGKETRDGVLSPALNADGSTVDQGAFFRDGFAATGEVRLLGTTIGRELSAKGAQLTGANGGPTLHADRAHITGSVFCKGMSSSGEVRLLNAKINGSLNLDGATLNSAEKDDGSAAPAFSADGLVLAGDLFCRGGFSASGEMRFLGAKIGGSLTMPGAALKANQSGQFIYTVSLDRAQVEEGIDFTGLTANGMVRLPGAKINGAVAMNGATLEGEKRGDDEYGPALNAERAEISDNMECYNLTAKGEVALMRVRIDGRLWMIGSTLESNSSEPALDLVAATVDELALAFRKVEGAVDLREVSVRSLWDAEDDKFGGLLPQQLRLEGFRYRSLREPLDAKRRLEWLAPSQQDRHFPGVYAELATAFRRMGHLGDARKVAIANERRARQDVGRWRRAGHDLLWVTIGYGYRNWLAGIWLLVLIGIGSVLFALNESSFTVITRHPPDFNPVLYAVDVTIPVLDIGQAQARAATGCLAWVGPALAVCGYALAAAVIAAAAGVIGRDQS